MRIYEAAEESSAMIPNRQLTSIQDLDCMYQDREVSGEMHGESRQTRENCIEESRKGRENIQDGMREREREQEKEERRSQMISKKSPRMHT